MKKDKLDELFGKSQYLLIGNYTNTVTPVKVKHSSCNKIFTLPPNEFAKPSKVYRYNKTCPNFCNVYNTIIDIIIFRIF
jgi:nitrous oxide reductase